jgi:uncharacterized protein YutE (UPF0331/DUF86 family)
MVDAERLRRLLDRVRDAEGELRRLRALAPSEVLAAMARFRNLLVHGYADVDDERVVATLQGDRLDDLTSFRQQLAARAEL